MAYFSLIFLRFIVFFLSLFFDVFGPPKRAMEGSRTTEAAAVYLG
jgi:hypothetical protein